MMSFSFFVFNRVVISIYQLALTSFALCGRLDQAALISIFAIGSALVTMIGQNAVRGQFERVRKIWRTTLLSGLIVVFGAAHLIVLLAPLIYPLFSDVEAVVWYAVTQTRIVEFSFVFAMVSIFARSLFQAIGYPIPALVIMLLRMLLLSFPVMLLLVYVLDMEMYGVWYTP